NIRATANALRRPRGSVSARERTSAICSSARNSTVATTRSSRVGKWCWAAPRDTPARSATRATVVFVQPCSARHSTAAVSNRRRVVLLRSCLGSRTIGRIDPEVQLEILLAFGEPVAGEVRDPLGGQHLVVDEELS